MRKRAWQFSIVMIIISIMSIAFSSAASATRYYGACGGGTTLKDNILGWKAHGVLDDVARTTGQKPGIDGPSSKIVRDNMVPVYLVKGTWVTNYTCSGGRFVKLARKKYLPPGTKLWIPEKNAPAKGKKKYVSKAEQANCGNHASGKMLVKRKGHSKPKHKPKKKPAKKKPTTPAQSNNCALLGLGVGVNGNCVNQNNEAKQDCKTVGGTNTGDQQACTQIQINNNCGNVVVVNGSDNNVSSSQGSNCVTVVNPPCTTDCAPQPSTAECTSFVLETNPAVNLGVKARVDYRASNATLSSVSFAWGDGNTTTGTSQEAAHVYSSLGTYTVIATLKFTTPSGNVSVTCSAKQITPKDGTTGFGSGSGSTGGSGAGGTGSSGSGQTCIDPVSGDPRPMASSEHKDNHGFCRLNV